MSNLRDPSAVLWSVIDELELTTYFRSIAAIFLACALTGLAHAANPPDYSVTDLGTLGGTSSTGNGINASGQVTGSSTLAGDIYTHAFVYSNGSMKDIGTLGGTYSVATAVNSSGQVAGFATTAGDAETDAFLYSNGSMIDLDPNDPYGPDQAYGINDSGHVTGIAEELAFLYSNGILNIINGTSHSIGLGINASDQVTGQANNDEPGSVGEAFIYTNGSTTFLGTLGGLNSTGNSIDASGNVTGNSGTSYDPNTGNDGPSHAFLADTAGIHDLGTLGGSTSSGVSINANNEVVGSSEITGNTTTHAFLYSNGSMVDLNSLVGSSSLAKDVTLTSATGITDSGWIIANGTDSRTGYQHAYLLQPSLIAPTVSLSPLSLSFPSMVIGSTSAPLVVTLKNTSTEEISISSVALTAGQTDDFALTTTCGASLAVNASCTASVIFAPVAVGAKQATFTVIDNASGSQRAVALTGTATAMLAPALTLSATSLSFASQQVETASAAKAIILTNTGAATLSISSIVLTGLQADDFSLKSACGSSLAPGKSCTLFVTFKPVAAGGKSAAVTIADDAHGSQRSVALTGTGL